MFMKKFYFFEYDYYMLLFFTLSEINKISEQLDKLRQKIILETASSQLKEQEKDNDKIYFH
ncbi:cI-like repressor [Lactococcus cremoris subsp. cremoris MG1363]|uniref:CI-like repressor n=3 Tax=Lactococcus lactis subsp. cremoris TaxID=1359 RepID=A2RIV1_LACLM|nr:cI-like repressor [Lactococcus cremoris subsp. cremoris MG1363]